jgi:hypothetical protein
MDFANNRFEQGAGHFLRLIDEHYDWVDFAPKGTTNLREFIHSELTDGKSSETKTISLCRILEAMGERETARRELLLAAQRFGPSHAILTLAELELLRVFETIKPEEKETALANVRDCTNRVLAQSAPRSLEYLWARLLVGGADREPSEPLEPNLFDPLIGDRPVLVLRPEDMDRARTATSKSGGLLPNRYVIGNSGTCTLRFSLDAPAGEIWILARGQAAMQSWPYVVVRLDGREIARLYLRLWAYRPYVLPVGLEPGKHEISFDLSNDEHERIRNGDTNAYLRAILFQPTP